MSCRVISQWIDSSFSSSVDASSFGCVILSLYLTLNFVIYFLIVGTFKSECKSVIDIYRRELNIARRTLFGKDSWKISYWKCLPPAKRLQQCVLASLITEDIEKLPPVQGGKVVCFYAVYISLVWLKFKVPSTKAIKMYLYCQIMLVSSNNWFYSINTEILKLFEIIPWLFYRRKEKVNGGPGSSGGIATGYGLDGPGIESRWGRDFPHLSRPAHITSFTMGTGSFSGVESGRDVTLTLTPL
jgi:hypothetical protein